MKTQGGAVNFPDKIAELKAKGFKKEVAAVKTIWMDQRMHVAVSEMTNRDNAPREHRRQSEHRADRPRASSFWRNTAWRPPTSIATAAASTASRRPAEWPSPTSSASSATTKSTASASRARELYQALPAEARTSPPPTWPPPRPPAPTDCPSSISSSEPTTGWAEPGQRASLCRCVDIRCFDLVRSVRSVFRTLRLRAAGTT